MKTVTLIRVPNYLLFDEKLQTPLGILQIAAYLRKHGIIVQVCDLAGEPPEQWANKIIHGDIIGISATTGDYPMACRVAEVAKSLYPKSLLVIGGAHASALPDESINSGPFDIAVIGEGEETIYELAMGNSTPNGICYRIPDGSIVTPPRPLQKKLDDFPFPAWDLIPDIVSRELVEHGEEATCITCSRGCSFRCSFCSQATFGCSYRVRSATNVMQEVSLLKHVYGINQVRLVDELTLADRAHFTAICKALDKLGLKWRTHTRVDLACRHPDLLKLAADCGCVEMALGVEDPNDRILQLVNKKTTRKQCSAAVEEIRDAGMKSKAYLIVGLPGCSKESVEQMKQWVQETNPDRCTLSTFIPYPGCDIWMHPERYGIKITTTDFKDYWILGTEYTNRGFVSTTAEMTQAELYQARQDLLQFLIDGGWKSPPPEGYLERLGRVEQLC